MDNGPFEPKAHRFAYKFPVMTEVAQCPAYNKVRTDAPCNNRGSIYMLIQHLNDHHAWTREVIADWLDSLDIDLTIKAQG